MFQKKILQRLDAVERELRELRRNSTNQATEQQLTTDLILQELGYETFLTEAVPARPAIPGKLQLRKIGEKRARAQKPVQV